MVAATKYTKAIRSHYPKILHLISGSGLLGAESVVLELAKETTQAGYWVAIGIFENSRNPHLELAEVAEKLGLRVHIFPCTGRFDFGTISGIRNFIQREKPDLLHTHGYKSDFYAFAATRNKLPWIVTNHLWKRTTFNLKLYASLDRFLIRCSKCIIAVSDEIAAEMVRMGLPSEKIAVIDNGIDLRRFSKTEKNEQLRKSFGFDTNSKMIGTVASLTEEKGHLYLLKAAKEILFIHPEARFLIVGDGVQRRQLEEKVSELGLLGKVIFTGSRRDIPEILSTLDMFVLPSLKEGLPMALLEAMAARLPVVATNVGAVPKVIAHKETGYLVQPRNTESLCAAVCELLSDTTKAVSIGLQGRRRVENQFSSKAMTERYFEVYTKALGIPFHYEELT